MALLCTTPGFRAIFQRLTLRPFRVIANASTRLSAAAAAIVVSVACGSAGQPPSSLETDFLGVWSGQYRIIRCFGDRHCPVGQTRSFFLRLSQAGSYVTGILGSDDLTADLSGTVGPTGDLTLTGWRPAASQFDARGDLQVRRFVLRLSTGSGLAGTLEYEVRFTADQNRETYLIVRHADIVSAIRGTPQASVSSFRGNWRGRYIARGCTLVGLQDCDVVQLGQTYLFELPLTQVGATVSGMLTLPQNVNGSIPVRGTVTQDLLTLDGSARQVVSGGTQINRVTAFTTVTDGFGHMRGSFRYVVEMDWMFGQLAGRIDTTTVDGALVSVVLFP